MMQWGRFSIVPGSAGATLLSALLSCSLQAPSEKDAFGGEVAQGGAAITTGGASPLGGSSANAGNAGELSLGGANGWGGAGSGGLSAGRSSVEAGTAGLDAGLLAHFAFDEVTGSVATDNVSGQNARYVGSCTHPAGPLGQAVGLRNMAAASVDWVELPQGLLVDLTSTTFAVWVRVLSTARSGSRLLDFSSTPGEQLYFVPDEINSETSLSGGHLVGTHGGRTFVELWSTKSLTDKAWHHVGISWSRSNVTLYVDGESAAASDAVAAAPRDLGRTEHNWVGRALDDVLIGLYAEVDDLRIYDRALSAADMRALFSAQAPP